MKKKESDEAWERLLEAAHLTWIYIAADPAIKVTAQEGLRKAAIEYAKERGFKYGKNKEGA